MQVSKCDPRFFRKQHASISLENITSLSQGDIIEVRPAHADHFDDIATLEHAQGNKVMLYHNPKYQQHAAALAQGLCVTTPSLAPHLPTNLSLVISKRPNKTFAQIADYFYQDIANIITDNSQAGCTIAASAQIGPGVVIGANVSIGEHTIIGPNTVIYPGVIIGDNCNIGANVTISHSIIHNSVKIAHGSQIGKSGFGFAMENNTCTLIPQLGRVIIEDGVHIGTNVSIDRGSLEDTVIGRNTMIDNLVQIAHNVKIGRSCIIVAQVGIAGSTILDDYVSLGGQVGIAGHLHIGKGAQVAAKSGVMRSIAPGQVMGGIPALPVTDWHKLTIIQQRLLNQKPQT